MVLLSDVEPIDYGNYNPQLMTPVAEKQHPPQIKELKDLDVLIHIPYFLHRHDFSMSDCWGVARLFYALHGWQFNIDEYYYKDKNGFVGCKYVGFSHYIKNNFTPTTNVDELEYGDLIIYGRHVVIFIRKGLLLGQSPLNTELLTDSRWWAKTPDQMGSDWVGYKRNKAKLCIPYTLTNQDVQMIKRNWRRNIFMPLAFNDYVVKENFHNLPNHWDKILLEFGYPKEQMEQLIKEAAKIYDTLKNVALKRRERFKKIAS